MNKNNSVSFDKWEKKCKHIKNINNDIDRVRWHYIGCMVFYKEVSNIIRNAISFFVLIFVFFCSTNRYSKKGKMVDALIVAPNEQYLLNSLDIPEELKNRYSNLEKYSIKKNSLYREIFSCQIDKSARHIIKECLKKYPFAFYMNLSIILHLSRYYKLILQYNPKAFITTLTELDYTTSIITNYCEEKGIKYIGVQHGEYCYNPAMAYVRFSEYYAWDKETIENMELVNTKIDYAHIYTPERLTPQFHKNSNPQFFLTFYLSGENETDLVKLKEVLLRFTRNGYNCCVRKHPHFLSVDLIHNLFDKTNIVVEDNSAVSIGESISNTKYIVSHISTVLTQGFVNNMPIVLDDVIGDLNYLKKIHYPNIKRATMLFSELIDVTLNK